MRLNPSGLAIGGVEVGAVGLRDFLQQSTVKRIAHQQILASGTSAPLPSNRLQMKIAVMGHGILLELGSDAVLPATSSCATDGWGRTWMRTIASAPITPGSAKARKFC
ncbi:hypothetical protein D3C76_1474320 [compost metagenome]